MKPYVLKNKCYVQPEICTALKACTNNAISFLEDEEEPLGGKIEIDYSKCAGCGTCVSVCCGDAMEMR